MSTHNPHESHCFIAMPSGRGTDEQREFTGWYQEVVKPAVEQAGFDAQLAVATNAPSAITDDILGHLAYDRMAVFDLGGIEPGDPPNPNVMYELGIRHALNLPAVIFISDPSRLPFDVSPQRAIVESRDFASMGAVREKLTQFIEAAASGNFYQPMRNVRRAERLAIEAQDQDQFLKDLVAEMSEIKRLLQEQRPVVDLMSDVALRFETRPLDTVLRGLGVDIGSPPPEPPPEVKRRSLFNRRSEGEDPPEPPSGLRRRSLGNDSINSGRVAGGD